MALIISVCGPDRDLEDDDDDDRDDDDDDVAARRNRLADQAEGVSDEDSDKDDDDSDKDDALWSRIEIQNTE